MNHYWITFGGAMIAVLAGTPLVGRIARRLGLVDKPNARKIHLKPIPRMGGVAIFVATITAAIVSLTELRAERAIDAAMYTRLMVTLGAAGCVFVIGILDDLCEVSSKIKLAGIFAAAAMVCASGSLPDVIVLGENMRLNLGWMGYPLAIFWIAGVTVSMNFIDGLDGLAAGIAAIACGALATMAYLIYEPAMMVLPLALMGSLTGFLVFNFNPARIFMGDSGSMFIGFLVGVCSLMNLSKGNHAGEILFPMLILGVPIIDTMLTMVRRSVLMRRSLFSAERGHIHHRLIDLGLSQRQAVMLLCGVTLLCTVSGLVMLIDPTISWKIGGLCLLILGMVFRLAGSIRLREIMGAILRNQKLGRKETSNRQRFEEMQLRFNVATNFDAWWREVCAAAEMMGFLRVYLPLQDRNGNTRVLAWMRPGGKGEMHDCISAEIPIRHRRVGDALRAEVVVEVNGSLENAGQRMSLFTRLMEEHSLESLPREANPLNRRMIPIKRMETAKTDSEIGHGNGNGNGHATHRVAGQVAVNDLKGTNGHRSTSMLDPRMKVAVVHDFLYCYAGAERVLEQILRVFPGAEIFSLFDFVPARDRGFLQGKRVHSSFIQRLPLAKRMHRNYLPLMPLAIEQLDVSGYDLVISSSYLAAKGIITSPDQLHICYCHSPVRYAWDLQHQYLAETGLRHGFKSLVARAILHYIRNWDTRSANGVDAFIANSDYVGRRILKVYRRRSETIYPPVDVENLQLRMEKADYYLTASRMVPYKRIDVIVEAFSRMPHKRLVVLGEGPEFGKIQAKAGTNVSLMGHVSFEQLRNYMQGARAFVFAAEEDFGIVPVEAQACGTPVIAYGHGGVMESVVPEQTGIFFQEQTPSSVVEAVERFERIAEWDAAAIRENATRFSVAKFKEHFMSFVQQEWELFQQNRGETAKEMFPGLGNIDILPAGERKLARV